MLTLQTMYMKCICRGSKVGNIDAFRSAYGQLGQLRAFVRNVPFVCLSATATNDTIDYIQSALNLANAHVVKYSINKLNIT